MRKSGCGVRVIHLILCAAAGLSGCSAKDDDAGPAAPAVPGARVEFRLERQLPGRFEFAWRFENRLPYAVFVPTKWQESQMSSLHERPVELVVPPSDLLFAYAPTFCCWEQAKEISLDYGSRCEYARVGPGEALEGRFTLQLPFQARHEYDVREHRQHLRSVFLYEGGYPDNTWWPKEREAEVSELTTIWFAVQYSLVGSGRGGLPEGERAYQDLYRLSVIEQALRGEKRPVDAFEGPLVERLVLSGPLKVRVPLKQPIILHFPEPVPPEKLVGR